MRLIFIVVLHLLSASSIAQVKENIHLHTDKDIYKPGETIWFKAFVFSNNIPSPYTTNLYTALYSQEGVLISQKRFPVFNGTSNGDFTIPSNLEGIVKLRLATKNSWSLDSNNTYRKDLYLSVPGKNINDPGSGEVKLTFLPEGGTLVKGIINHLVVRATQNNKPIKIQAALYEVNNNRFIDSVFTGSDGLGTVQIVPVEGSIIARANYQGKLVESILPTSILNGAVLHTEMNKNNTLYYVITKNTNIPRFDTMHVYIKDGKQLIYQETIRLKEKQLVHAFKTDSLPAGILEILLTDKDDNILQKKLINIIRKTVAPKINIVTKSLVPNGQNTLEIDVEDSSIYNLSLSIADANAYEEDLRTSIYDELLLDNNRSTILGDAIKNDDYKKSDVVLQTNSLFWQNFYKPLDDNFLSIKVEYREKNRMLPVEKGLLTLMINDSLAGQQFFNVSQTTVKSDTTGLIFFDSAKIFYQIEKYKHLTSKLFASSDPGIQFLSKISPIEFQTEKPAIIEKKEIQQNKNVSKNLNEFKTIKEVRIQSKINPATKRLEELDKKYTSGMFRGNTRGFQLNVLDDPTAERYLDVYQYIIYRIPGLSVKGTAGSRFIVNAFDRGINGGVPLLYINETASDSIDLESVMMSEVAYIKYIPGIVIGSAFRTADGAIYVYTKKGDEPGKKTESFKTQIMQGYSIPKNFIMASQMMNEKNASTLYWNPYIVTSKENKKVTITYTNNDTSKKHLITLRGIAMDGNIVEIRLINE